MELETAKQAVVAVGNKDGRGFAINTDPRLIVTAAHCLPELPPPHPGSYGYERTYADIVGRIGKDRQEIYAECLFADPVADIAVLGEPDGVNLSDEHYAFEAFMDQIPALECGRSPPPPPLMEEPHQEQAWLLGLGGEWEPCQIKANRRGGLGITEALKGIVGGMSGSPIMNPAGEAIGVVSTSGGTGDNLHTEGGPQASLRYHLPGWVFLLAQNRAD
jgi:hypothetical protein